MNPIDRLLRTTLVERAPTEGEIERIDTRYREGIRANARTRTHTVWSRLVIVAAVVVALVAAAVVIQATRPATVSASLQEIAYAASVVDVSTLGSGDYYYTESTSTDLVVGSVPGSEEHIAYLIPESRRVWVSRTGTFVIEATLHAPVFFDDDSRALYYRNGMDVGDRIGLTTVTAQSSTHTALKQDWPTDPDALARAIRAKPSVQTDTDVVNFALNLIRESPASPQLRAATVLVLANLHLRVVDRTETNTTFETIPTGQDDSIIRFELRNDGQLLRIQTRTVDGFPSLGIPAGFAISDANYGPTALVEEVATSSQ
ncbi:MAG TPA: hypothetical protein ENH00_01135 [Actinobacteria bacterium]|nr:hypothetical protein BMS3Bbin01_01166 [bacterium BMS3Bbin01]HDH24782.1 hypothetical protein [Actinomycetota bacterium]